MSELRRNVLLFMMFARDNFDGLLGIYKGVVSDIKSAQEVKAQIQEEENLDNKAYMSRYEDFLQSAKSKLVQAQQIIEEKASKIGDLNQHETASINSIRALNKYYNYLLSCVMDGDENAQQSLSQIKYHLLELCSGK